MKLTYTTVILSTILLQSCGSSKKIDNSVETFWVSGMKSECSSGAGRTHCLQINKGDNLESLDWQTFYAPIEGFDFQEGTMQRIKVKVEKLDPNNVPADASSLRYTLVEVVKKQPDFRAMLNGEWELDKINDADLPEGSATADLNFDFAKNRVSGFDGCNNFTGVIEKLTPQQLTLGKLAFTRKMCVNMSITAAYGKALEAIKTYQMKGFNLTFYNESGEKILSFKKKENVDQRINDIWVATRIKGNPINRMITPPRLEVNLSDHRVSGTDGCNDYTTSITNVTANDLSLGMPSVTQKACIKENVAEDYINAFRETARYKVEKGTLTLYNAKGEEVLFFLKAD